ncbi:probable BOI-related E3 ubiquitin-protein ligase 2 [Salvia hispanica]|uniref:probable BOI-related E3 ubiquitin-protein ligase 2 n=1 Tax=Salvia hispanica TaxID=49212 RepID=UPI002009A8B1|nr:probable BOI-related E3 ubiquitin-protein ligase 2 [Salvia hispanica]
MAIQAQLFSENLGFPLGNSQDLMVENGCGFDNLCFAPQQHHQLTQLDQFQNSSRISVENNAQFHQFMTFSQSVSSHIERQRLEFEQFLNLQNERLRMAMQEQRKQHISVLMTKYEWKSDLLLKQKDEEIAKAANRTTELHNFMKKMEIENLTWQRVAKENEAMIASLNDSIQRLRESAFLSENAAEDAESCCDEQEKTETKKKTVCRICNTRNSCVVMLPCRHLCSCKDCEVFLDSCPVCSMPKKAAIEALI